jgi:hypothetical protein
MFFHTYNASTGEAEARGLRVPGQLGLRNVFQNTPSKRREGRGGEGRRGDGREGRGGKKEKKRGREGMGRKRKGKEKKRRKKR